MANTLSNFIREVWAPRVQRLATKSLVARDVCNFELQSISGDGDTFHRPYHSEPSVGTYTRNATSSAVSASDISTTDEYLTVDQAKYASFFIDRLDDKQMLYKALKGKLQDRSVYQLRDTIDAAILAEYSNAGLDLDAGDISGSDGTSITLSTGTSTGNTGNILDVLEAFKAKLAGNDVENNGDWFLVVDPTNYYKVIEKYMATNGYKVQDSTLVNGYMGKLLDVDIYISRNLSTSTVSTSTTTHWLGGKRKAIDLVVQQEPKLEVKDLPQNDDGTVRLGTQYILWTLYGKKTFTEGARELVDIQIAS